MKKTVEIDDSLQECVDSACSAVADEVKQYLDDNPDTDSAPDLGKLDYSGAIHEIIDGSVPIYTNEIRDIMYLHKQEVEEAFNSAGLGSKDDNWPMGWEAAAIYCYIEQEVNEWYRNNSDDLFDEWKEEIEEAQK